MLKLRVQSVALMIAAAFVATAAQAEIVTQEINYTHNDTTMRGYLAYDDALPADQRVPGVLVIHEWWGLTEFPKQKARELAAMGYVAFAADMYGEGKTTDKAGQAMALAGSVAGKPVLRERAQAALDVLKANERVDANRLAAIGFCFGGTAALELAYGGADLRGAVSFHGNPAPPFDEDTSRIKAKLLVLHGAADPLVPRQSLETFEASMQQAKVDYQIIIYSGAVHSFTNPDANMPPAAVYHEQAARRAWQHMKVFFDEIFAGE